MKVMSYWTGLYSGAKVHVAGADTGEHTLCHTRIEPGWVESSGPPTCKRCLRQLRKLES